MVKAFYKGYEVFDLEFCAGWVEIAVKKNDFESPITGTACYRVRMEDIVLEEAE